MQGRNISTQEVVREGILTSNPLRAHQQCELTMLGEDKNKNGKRITEIVRETHIIGKKARKLSKKKTELEKLQGVTEKKWKTSQEVGLQDLNLAKKTKPHIVGLLPGEDI
jgi:hypothetical protein